MSKWEAYRHLPLVAELENTFVLEEFRSQWIGCKLYNTFVKWCTKKNVGKIRVQASAQNEWAIRFYRNNNFKDYTLILETDL
jgi:GNAT superfamily N-acetyltransferase